MYCGNCGNSIPDGSRFCNFCGRQVPSVPSRVADQPPVGFARYDVDAPAAYDQEHILFTLRPTMIFVGIWYVIAALIVLGATVVLALLRNLIGNTEAIVIIILVVALLAFSIPVWKQIMRLRQVYTLTNHKLEMRLGILARTLRNIPLRNIQDVTVVASATQRLLGLGDIVIDSASESGKIFIEDVRAPEKYADMILTELRRRSVGR